MNSESHLFLNTNQIQKGQRTGFEKKREMNTKKKKNI